MLVHLAQRAGIEFYPLAVVRALNRKHPRRDDALFPTREPPRRDRPQTILVGQLARLQIRAAERLPEVWHLALGEVHRPARPTGHAAVRQVHRPLPDSPGGLGAAVAAVY